MPNARGGVELSCHLCDSRPRVCLRALAQQAEQRMRQGDLDRRATDDGLDGLDDYTEVDLPV